MEGNHGISEWNGIIARLSSYKEMINNRHASYLKPRLDKETETKHETRQK